MISKDYKVIKALEILEFEDFSALTLHYLGNLRNIILDTIQPILPFEHNLNNMLEDNYNFALWELAIFSIIHIVQFVVRFIQERRYWHHDRPRSFGWCFTYSWWGMIGMLSQRQYSSCTRPASS
jgi:hypothetical protein